MICYYGELSSPIGTIAIAATDEALVYCASPRKNGDEKELFIWLEKYMSDYRLEKTDNHIIKTAKDQLEAYFAGESKILDVPLQLIGTPFRKTVWEALLTIPYGETRTYGQIAAQIGKPKASRAVGQANHHNPVSYFVP